jgi:hypothetical protein
LTSSIARPSKIYPNWYFWFENIPSGNPVAVAAAGDVAGEAAVDVLDAGTGGETVDTSNLEKVEPRCVTYIFPLIPT